MGIQKEKMKHKRLTIEFAVENLILTQRLVAKKETTHTILATLIWPRPAIREKKLLQAIKVDKNGNMQLDLPWDKTILGKETIQGPFALKIAVFKNMADKKQAEFFRYLIAETSKEVGDYVSDIIDIPLASDLVDIPFDYFAKKIGLANEEVGIIGSTCMNIEIDSNKDTLNTSELTTPRDFYTTKTLTRAGKRTRVRKKILKKGEVIGSIQIALKIYE
jgi:hypothetical protein